jgi:putative transposase
MNFSISLSPKQRNALLHLYRCSADPELSHRAHLILLLAEGYAWATIIAVLFTSSSTIARWQRRYLEQGIDGLRGQRPGRRPLPCLWCLGVLVRWVTTWSPRTFGFLRSRWTCALLTVVLLETCQVAVSRETVRRWLHQANLVWRRPRPVVRIPDPQRAAKLKALRHLLAHLPDDETAVFEDEVDVNTNPKIGSMWMLKGQQTELLTPGTNDKRYLAGSVNWRTGALFWTAGKQRNGELFVRHLDELRHRLRCYRVIHVICDNARFHKAAKCKKVQAYLEQWGGRVVLHYLPTSAPETNPIERLWWHLHEEISRCHTCRNMEDLLAFTFAWLENRNPYALERTESQPVRAA